MPTAMSGRYPERLRPNTGYGYRTWRWGPLVLTAIPWVVLVLGWSALHSGLGDLEKIFGTDAQRAFVGLLAIVWLFSGIALVTSARSIHRSSQRRLLRVCVVASALLFVPPMLFAVWLLVLLGVGVLH